MEARPSEDVPYEEARAALYATLEELRTGGVGQEELTKVIHKLEQRNHYREANISERASELVFYAALGEPELINTEIDHYLSLTVAALSRSAERYLAPERRTTLEYLSALPV